MSISGNIVTEVDNEQHFINVNLLLIEQFYPSRHNTLNQCWFKVYPRLRRWTDVKLKLIQRLVSA